MRIALVNDVMAAVEAMRRVVLSTREHQLAWTARDGREALALCARDTDHAGNGWGRSHPPDYDP
jgi:two-component system response regulator WspF